MAAFLARPEWWLGIAFNRDPGDNIPVPNWADLTAKLRSVQRNSRGEQYELAQSLAASPQVLIRDPDEYLNPANTASPYYPNVLPYRECCWLGQWPNSGTGNLLNLGTWRTPIDPSFESYTAGATVPWITAVGGMTPVVGTVTPNSGTKDLTWTQTAANATQGVSWPLKCIPGRQYTASAYLRMVSAVSQSLSVTGLTAGLDAFQRTVASSWGTADVGGAWSTAGGAASDYNIANPVATITQTSVNVFRETQLSSGLFIDSNTAAYVSIPVMVTGSAIRVAVLGRSNIAVANWYGAYVDFHSDASVTVAIIKNITGTETSLGSFTLGAPYAAGDVFGIRLDVTGTTISAKAWPQTSIEPTAYQVVVTDTALGGTGGVGTHVRLLTGNTNTLPVVATFYGFGATGTRQGSSTSATGAWTRLSLTFTATQPDHTALVGNWGGAGVAGNVVLLDDIQHEQAAAASAFTTAGPVIYPVMRNYAERFTRGWDPDTGGYVGYAAIPCVDALAALAGPKIDTEYREALTALNPDYWWPLNDKAGVTTFREIRGGPSLVIARGSGTPNTGTASSGAGIAIVGDPGANGVSTAGSTDTHKGLTLQAKKLTLTTTGATWSLTLAVWAAWTDVTNTFGLIALSNKSPGNTTAILRSGTADLKLFSGTVYVPAVGGTSTADAPSTYADGNPHFLVMTNSLAAGTFVTTLYVDGVLAATASQSAATFFGTTTPAFHLDTLELAGGQFGYDLGNGVNATYAHACLWRRALSAAEVTTLWTAGGLGLAGELTGVRMARHFALGRYVGPTRISAGAGTMQAASTPGQTALAVDALAIATTEMGHVWVAPDGAFVFESRTDRFLRLTATYVLGENTAGGEIPYDVSALWDDDPTYVFGDVEVTRPGGATAVGGDPVSLAANARRYFGKAFDANVDVQTDQQAQDYANWVFYTHKDALQRIDPITVDPTGNPVLWPFVLGVEVGQRITAKRRPLAANAGAGITMSADFFVESVTHDGVDMDTGTWTTTLVLSPIGTAPGTNSQPWILDNATYSVLGLTTIPAM